jgi:hypothetical protein
VAVLYAISTQTEPTLAFTTRQDAGAHHGPLAETPVSPPPFLGDQPIILLPCSLYLYLDIEIHHLMETLKIFDSIRLCFIFYSAIGCWIQFVEK